MYLRKEFKLKKRVEASGALLNLSGILATPEIYKRYCVFFRPILLGRSDIPDTNLDILNITRSTIDYYFKDMWYILYVRIY